jgi:TonB family protein
MSTGTTSAPSRISATQRKVPRFKLTVPLGLTVLRSGVPYRISGKTTEIGEGGLGVVAASRLLLGESVRVEFLLPHMTTPVQATALVRYQHEHRFGLQFLRLPDEQKSIIRYWTRGEADVLFVARQPQATPASVALDDADHASTLLEIDEPEDSNRRLVIRRIVVVAVCIMAIAALVGWWRWQQGWNELEAQIAATETAAMPRLQVPADVMQQRIIHQVVPDYPEDARRAGLQGTVVLDAVVSAEGKVTQVKVVSGPEELALAASDAVRWWRYEPYLVNGQPATVETSVAVDFRLAAR